MPASAVPPLDQDDLVHALLRAVAGTAYVPRSAADVEKFLAGLVHTLTEALAAEPFDPAPGAEVGGRMVIGGLVGADSLARSLDVLAAGLLGAGAAADRVVALLAAVASGYAGALRKLTLDQQEDMKRALLSAKRRAERDHRATESRLREVFNSSAIGIAITELDGQFVDTNPALAVILGCGPADLAGRSLTEFVSTDDPVLPPVLTGTELDRLPARKLLVRHNGETAWVYLVTSLIRDDAGTPAHRVAMLQDLSELQLLQDQLSHQLLHDALTGAANRGHFESRLEAVIGQAEPGSTITLCCLDLDAFSLVNTTHGHAAGDRLLQTVAERLKTAVAAEKAMVARIGGDEFAVLVQDGPETPSVPELVELINAELAEPAYDGPLGIAVGATIGVVRCGPGAMSSTELFRAADAALRLARATGRRQWTEYDGQADKRIRQVGVAALALPAAWENGDLDLAYVPVVRLADDKPVRVRAVVHQARTRPLPGRQGATDLAELTGLSVALGPWLLTRSTERVPVWQALFTPVADPGAPVHRVLLSPLQSADADLSGAVNRAVEAAGIAPGLLEIGLDTATVLGARGDAHDNMRTLGDIGVATALHGFSGGPREIALVERFRVDTVLLADPFEGWRPDWLPNDSVPVRGTRELIAAVHSIGAAVGVVGVRDHAEARWWAGLGVATAEGPAFGEPGDVDDVLARFRAGKQAAK
ncbi:diguanylate cyclase domain-containing protein [Actinokineospora sp.]|uniref:diguanylate cyclase domain-containing protein n=1 Tax=Actinokineospora sp. TaxID=1872133 RepID=UPI00403797A5